MWARKLSAITEDEALAWPFAESTSGRVVLKGEELGEYTLPLERDSKPLRWACRNYHKLTTVRLIDDTGAEDAPAFQLFSFRDPLSPIPLEAEIVRAGLDIADPGGLFHARLGKFEDDITVSLPPIGRGFADLLIEPNVHALDGEAISTPRLLDALRLWSRSRLVGPLVAMRRNRILERLANRLYARLCGDRWAAAETSFIGQASSSKEQLTAHGRHGKSDHGPRSEKAVPNPPVDKEARG